MIKKVFFSLKLYNSSIFEMLDLLVESDSCFSKKSYSSIKKTKEILLMDECQHSQRYKEKLGSFFKCAHAPCYLYISISICQYIYIYSDVKIKRNVKAYASFDVELDAFYYSVYQAIIQTLFDTINEHIYKCISSFC